MADSGYLAPPEQKPEQKKLWEQTWKHLDRFLPNLKTELFPKDDGKARNKSEKQTPPPAVAVKTAEGKENGAEKVHEKAAVEDLD